eukprot:1146914-Pelagomonas_calceolata.AAC.33
MDTFSCAGNRGLSSPIRCRAITLSPFLSVHAGTLAPNFMSRPAAALKKIGSSAGKLQVLRSPDTP